MVRKFRYLPLPISWILNPVPETIRGFLPRPKVAKGTKEKKKREACWNLKSKIKDHALKFYVTTELSNALPGMVFGFILGGESMVAKKELRRLLIPS